jgi:DNA (cytosine-5)-methyltransferase 1
MTHPQFTLGSLFSGIGGLEYGLEMTGAFKTVWQVEQSEYCRKVLRKHWPDALQFEDVRNVGRENLPAVDVICGGFPCQDISNAGRKAGIVEGNRSGLWHEYVRIIRELRPQYVIVENVSALLVRGLDVVLGELAESGYDAEWSMLSAADVGAPHLRQRIFVVAHASGKRAGRIPRDVRQANGRSVRAVRGQSVLAGSESSDLANASRNYVARRRHTGADKRDTECIPPISNRSQHDVANPNGFGRDGRAWRISEANGRGEPAAGGDAIAHASGERLEGQRKIASRIGTELNNTGDHCGWESEPAVGRVANGIPRRVDRLRALGNAVVPQCARVIGEWLLEIDAELSEGAA